ncbi:MAG: aminotransferase class I/II-fold pyridoxal phosphate-dependent enzyme [Myxococcota bacterium]
MSKFSAILDACDHVGMLARERRLGLLDAEDERLDGRTIRIDGRTLHNFSSCSYLGLELDPRLIEGAIDATRRYGTQFSMSRAFVSAPPYAELEATLEANTDRPTLVLPTTSLATAAALPSLLDERDALILDQQVHMSVQSVLPTLVATGVHVETVPHGDLERVEERTRALSADHRRIWFAVDGLFSMYGDAAPFDALACLLAACPSLHLYVDDAHGTSWAGRHGRGLALERLGHHDRVVVALSLNKSFAAGGGALCFPNEDLKRRVRHVSGPTNFGGPMQPPMLGAALASARLHASDALPRLQHELRARIDAVNALARAAGLPLLCSDETAPIRFVGVGPQAASIEMAEELMRRGFMAGCALFPAVPPDRTGLRFTVTRHHTREDLEDLVSAMAEVLPAVLARHDLDVDDVADRFGLKPSLPGA